MSGKSNDQTIKCLRWGILEVAICMGLSSYASNPYNFGGPCSSQSSWTQEALLSTSRIREVTNRLKNDEACKAFSNSLQTALSKIDQSVQTVTQDERSANGANRLSQISQEISGLRNFLNIAGDLKNRVLQLTMSLSLESAGIAAEIAPPVVNAVATAVASPMVDIGRRVTAAATDGISMMNQVIDSIPMAQQCLASPTDFANYLAGSVYVLGSFLGSGQDGTGALLAQSVSKMANYAREMKFSEILRNLNVVEYRRSMACLLEVSSETYCSARDAMMIFEQGQKDLLEKETPIEPILEEKESNSESKDDTHLNPFQGYYILTQHVPNITTWLQRIQIGVDPKLPTDAQFKNQVLDETVNFYQTVNQLLGTYEKENASIYSQSSVEAQQSIALNLIINISETLGTASTNQRKNFFLSKLQPIFIPFFLIGISADKMPDSVVNVNGAVRVSWQDYLRQEYIKMSQFRDPKRLMIMVGENLKSLIDTANTSLIEYYSQWFIVDKQALVHDSVTSMTYTVRDSLIAVNKYLKELYVRTERIAKDQTSLASVIDLRSRIEKILMAFQQITAAVEKLKKMQAEGTDPAGNATILKLIEDSNANLIVTVYEQFMVMLARSGFLQNRMITLVYGDYANQLKAGVKFDDYQEELMYATGKSAFEKILSLHSGNPANVKADLQMALNINKENLASIELLFKDTFVSEIARMNLIAKNIPPTRKEIRKDSRARAMFDIYIADHLPEDLSKMPADIQKFAERQKNLYGAFCFVGILGFKCSVEQLYQEWMYSERYPIRYSMFTDDVATIDTEFGSAAYLRDQFCIQALAFNDWRSMWGVCHNAKLKSPFWDLEKNQEQIKKYRDYLSVDFSEQLKKDAQNPALNHSERICAFRDFNRKNLVFYLTLGLNKVNATNP